MAWRFTCPACRHVASAADWFNAGAPPGTAGFSCVGRWTGATASFDGKTRPCTYAGGGLFRLNPVHVARADGNVVQMFAFSDQAAEAQSTRPPALAAALSH
jgi:hypothetical protein